MAEDEQTQQARRDLEQYAHDLAAEAERRHWGGEYPYPAEWGLPPGTARSDERLAWVRKNVRQCEKRGASTPMGRLAEITAKRYGPITSSVHARRAQLIARRYGPGE